MATTQLYFWFASFAWMVCISLDLFQCLSKITPSALSHVGFKYHFYVLAGWVIPSLIPLSLTVLTVTKAMSVYDVKTCWLSGPKNVFYFFALPVLCVVMTNVFLFVGSMCRLRAMWENATFVGRREDIKQRLIQCVKMSSSMGISWLFGIIPNFFHVEALWYVFAASNTFQGVHILFAFGLTGRSRILKRGNNHADTVQVPSTNVPPVVAQSDNWPIYLEIIWCNDGYRELQLYLCIRLDFRQFVDDRTTFILANLVEFKRQTYALQNKEII